MAGAELQLPKIKHYPHFDAPISDENIQAIITNPNKVKKNAFFPFLQYEQKWVRFDGKLKNRQIAYACRRDAYIYSHYRSILLKKYEQTLTENDIQNCPITYRQISLDTYQNIGKCNIHFANEAFEEILRRKNCFAIAMDIEKFFPSMDHELLKQKWCCLLNIDKLPPDHQVIFNTITNYAYVDRHTCYTTLGYVQEIKQNGRKTTALKKIPKKLCNRSTFKEKIRPLIKKNESKKGIPQGSPISDVLANLYLLDFDKAMADIAKKFNAYYRRYSDDILFICEPNTSTPEEIISYIEKQLFIEKLKISSTKTNITEFSLVDGKIKHQPYQPENEKSNKSFEYLGFAFDGQNVRIKNSTLAAFNRKLLWGIRSEAENLIKRYPNLSPKEVFDRSYSDICEKYGGRQSNSKYDKTNFWLYAKSAIKIMGNKGNKISRQLKNRKVKISEWLAHGISNKQNLG